MPTPVRVAVVNDYEIVVAGIAAVLTPFQDRVRVVELDARMPVVSDVDVVLYDTFGQAQGNALDVARLVAGSSARAVVFSWNSDDQLVDEALKRGVAGCLSKGLSAEELVDALERVHAGEILRPERGSAPAEDAFGRWPGEQHGLSARESEVLALICQGLTNQAITEHAFLGMNTIKTYIRTLYRKIGVDSRTQAVLWGVAHGFEPDRSRRLEH